MWIQQKPNVLAPIDDLQGRTVGLKFECGKCHTEVFTDLIGVPAPDTMASSMEEVEQFEKEELKCPGCEIRHQITIDSTFDGVRFNVSESVPGSVNYQLAEPEA